MKNEADVKKRVKEILNAEHNCWWYMPVQTGYGVRGIPDFIVCLEGRLIGIETKFGSNKESTWQKRQGQNICNAGGLYLVITDKNVENLHSLIHGAHCDRRTD